MVAKKMQRLFAIMAVLLFGMACVAHAQVFANEPIILDNANLLSDSEKEQLYNDMLPILEYGGVAFITNEDEYDGYASDYAQSACYEIFDGSSGVVFLIDMYNRRIELFSTGDMYKSIGKMWANAITDNVYIYASDEDYYTCASKCFGQIVAILEGSRISVPMRHVSNFLMAIGLALALLFLIVFFQRSPKKTESKKSFLGWKMDIDDTKVMTLVDKVMTKEVKTIHTSSSSGSGRSGGGGGGHSGGGGGGHGF